jgi:hypothetical protein
LQSLESLNYSVGSRCCYGMSGLTQVATFVPIFLVEMHYLRHIHVPCFLLMITVQGLTGHERFKMIQILLLFCLCV